MYFLELGFQGVRGFPSPATASLRPSYVVLKPRGPEPVPLASVCSAVLFSADTSQLLDGQGDARASLTVFGNDQNTYRLIRELGRGSTLQQLNAVNQRFELLSEEQTEITQFLRSQVGFPPKKAFDQLFTLNYSQFPSRRPAIQPAAMPTSSTLRKLTPPPSAGLGSAHPVEPVKDPVAARAKLGDLEKELALSREVSALQSRVDELSSDLFEVERKVKATAGMKQTLAEAQQAWEKAPTPESLNLSPDIAARAQRYQTVVAKRDQALSRLEQETQANERAPRWVEPLNSNRYFLAFVALGVVMFALGLFLSGRVRYVAFLDIPAFAVAAFLALKYVDDLRESQAAGRKGARIASRGKKVQDEFEAEAQYVKAAMAALSVQSPEEIIEALSLKAKLGARVTELRQQLAQAEQSPDYRTALANEKKLRKELDGQNAELAKKGAYVRDAGEVEREINRLKQSLSAPKPAAAPVDDVPSAVTSPSAPAEDPFPALVATAADLLGLDPNALVAGLRERCLQYFAALTEHRYNGLEFEKGFTPVAVAENQRLRANSLPAADRDLLYLAARLTLVEKHSSRAKVPLLVEDVGTMFDEVRLTLLGRMFKRLGAMTQVIHVAAQPAATSAAEAVINL